MTVIYETFNKTRKVSKARNKALILPVPATVRDIMNFEHGTPIHWEVCLENEQKYIKIYEKID